MTLGMPSRGNLGNPLALQITASGTTTINPQDLYSGKKVRLLKVGAQNNLGSVTGQLVASGGAPIPMGFGRFAFSKGSSTTLCVVDYSSSGIGQVRSNTAVTGRGLSNAIFRGQGGVGYWYTTASVLNRVTASGAAATSNTALATVSTLAASGTITNGGAAYSALSLPASNRAVAKYGDNLVHVGTATVSAATKIVAVLVSLSSATVSAVFDLGTASTADTVLQAVAVYKDILTVFWLNQNTATSIVAITPIQFNLQTQQLTNLTSVASFPVSAAQGTTLDPVCYACNGAAWVDMSGNSSSYFNYNYGFATNSLGVATDHGASASFNTPTFSTTGNNASFLENRTNSGRVRDFDYNLVYGYSAYSMNENVNDIKNAETILLQDDYRFQAMARARAPIAFMESSKRLPVSLSLVCAGTGDQTAATGVDSGYDALITYLDNGYWVLMATDGDSAGPSYVGYLQLYREA